jgi:hypothetical protein
MDPKVHWFKIFLLVLNIGMEEIEFVERNINLPPPPLLLVVVTD